MNSMDLPASKSASIQKYNPRKLTSRVCPCRSMPPFGPSARTVSGRVIVNRREARRSIAFGMLSPEVGVPEPRHRSTARWKSQRETLCCMAPRGNRLADCQSPRIHSPHRKAQKRRGVLVMVIVIAVAVPIVIAIPMVVVIETPAIAIPISIIELSALVPGSHPSRTRIGGASPVSFVPFVMAAYGIPIALDPYKIRPRLSRQHSDYSRARRWPNPDTERNLCVACGRAGQCHCAKQKRS